MGMILPCDMFDCELLGSSVLPFERGIALPWSLDRQRIFEDISDG